MTAVALVALAMAAGATAAPLPVKPLPPQTHRYTIDVALDPETRGLTGTVHLRWTNPSDAPVRAVPLHLYLNAFSHEATTWMRELSGRFGDRKERLLDQHEEPWGWTDPTRVEQLVGDVPREVAWRAIQPDDGNVLDRTLAEVTLAEPVAAGGELALRVAFEARLPVPIARTGGYGDYFFVAQWFPKLGVLEPAGRRGATAARWAARQFHGPTEFYADFADYDVRITVPEGWLVAGTGTAEGVPEATGDGRLRHRFTQRSVIDFAFAVGRGLVDEVAPHRIGGTGPTVALRVVVPEGAEPQLARIREAAAGTLDVMAERVGTYPWDTLTVLAPPHSGDATSGMEYPTFVTALPGDPLWDRWPFDGLKLQELVVVHEVLHNTFQGLIATNEQEEGYLDEGFTSYWEGRVMRALWGGDAGASTGGWLLGRPVDFEDRRRVGLADVLDTLDEPLRKRPTALYRDGTWGLQIYSRTAVTLLQAERRFGAAAVDRVFAAYFDRFAFGHPNLESFLTVAAQAGPPGLEPMLREAFERPALPNYRVASATSAATRAPLGRVPFGDGHVVVTRDDVDDQPPELGRDPAAAEIDGHTLMEVTDPGWVRGGAEVVGTVERRSVAPGVAVVPDEDWEAEEDVVYESEVVVEGPSWDHLPVALRFRFADGRVVNTTWDGRAPWRRYRFVRAAPLKTVWIDPDGQVPLDVDPVDDARHVTPRTEVAGDWAAWLAGVAQWLAGGASLWL